MLHHITVFPQKRNIPANEGETLLDALRAAGLSQDAPCGGNGACGKCKVLLDGREVLACKTLVDRDMTVTLPQQDMYILTDGLHAEPLCCEGVCLAIDIGTTTVAAFLIADGQVLATESRKNPQASFGADVVSRIHYGIKAQSAPLTATIQNCVADITNVLLQQTGKSALSKVCIVGNPAMQQLLLGMPVKNLATPPFSPLLVETKVLDGGTVIPQWKNAELLIVPNISGYIGADTVACILATGMDQSDKLTLLLDIGTNGEMVLGNKDRLVACATAAGPALEGAGIQWGMQAAAGAIDHVDTNFTCHVIGEAPAKGICGSGLLDAVAAALHNGLINQRGRILNASHTIPLTNDILLTQEDIRQLQQAKGAIAAGIRLMADHLGVSLDSIETVYLAGAFGTFLDPHTACRVGLIPVQLEDKIQSIGNAAGSGAKSMVCNRDSFLHADQIVASTELLELATLPDWARYFAQSMRFDTEEDYWRQRALSSGFFCAVPLDPKSLSSRQDVRSMCAADKCGAYGKNHTCPPYCGTLEACEAEMQSFSRGLLVQTVGATQKTIDTKAYRHTERQHLEAFHQFCDAFRAIYPHALCLGSGGCRVCKKCAFPDPCLFPEKAYPSMEAYGLFVADVCRQCGASYHHGERTITYTSCILF